MILNFKDQKGVSKRSLSFLIILAVVLLGILIGIWLYYSQIEEIKILEMDAYVSKSQVGFNLDKDKIHFGIAQPGTLVLRTIFLNSSGKEYPLKVMIETKGSIAEYLTVKVDGQLFGQTAIFTLYPNETKEISYGFFPLIGAEEKMYEGKSQIVFMKKLFG